jgi:RNA polymerase sigma factor (sigma-70 family)
VDLPVLGVPVDLEANTSASLLVRIRDPQDATAWSVFVKTYTPLLRRYCQRKGLQDADAADITQDVFLKVSQAIRSFEYAPQLGKFRNWLGVLTRNAIHDYQTRAGRLPKGALLGQEPSDVAEPEWFEDFTSHILEVALEAIRPEFSPETWSSFEAAWIRNEAPGDVAKRLEIAVHAVYVNKSRVLKRLTAEVLRLAEELPLESP